MPAAARGRLVPRALQHGRLGGAPDERVAAAGGVQRRGPAAAPTGAGVRRGRGAPPWSSRSWTASASGAGRGAELVAQQPAQVVERAQRLGRVARRLVRLHQQPVRGLAERRRRHGGARGRRAPRPARRRAATPRRAPRARAPAVPPARRAARRATGRRSRAAGRRRSARERRAGRRAGLRPRARRCSAGLGAAGRGARPPRRRRRTGPVERQAQLRAAGQRALAERAPQLGEQRAERRVGRGGRLLGPERVDQLAARRAGAVAMEREVGEQEPPLAARKAPGRLAIGSAHLDRPAEPDGPA